MVDFALDHPNPQTFRAIWQYLGMSQAELRDALNAWSPPGTTTIKSAGTIRKWIAEGKGSRRFPDGMIQPIKDILHWVDENHVAIVTKHSSRKELNALVIYESTEEMLKYSVNPAITSSARTHAVYNAAVRAAFVFLFANSFLVQVVMFNRKSFNAWKGKSSTNTAVYDWAMDEVSGTCDRNQAKKANSGHVHQRLPVPGNAA